MSQESRFGLKTLGQVSVTAHDLDRAIGFYRDALGMKLLFRVPKMAFFDCDGTRLMLSIPEAPEFDHPSSILYFAVADIAAGYAELSARGVSFKGPPHLVAKMPDHELWMAFFEDSEVNTHALMSQVR